MTTAARALVGESRTFHAVVCSHRSGGVPTHAVAVPLRQEQGPAVSALSDALVEANVEGWSAREIARRGGERVSHSQIGKYLKPTHPRPGEDVLQVFSDVFRIPMPRLRQLAALPAGDAEPYEPPAEANRLDSRQRRVVNELIRMLAETRAGDGGCRSRRRLHRSVPGVGIA
jgi:hypothetical protein